VLTVDQVTALQPGEELWITNGAATERDLVTAVTESSISVQNGFREDYTVAAGSYLYCPSSDFAREPNPNGNWINLGAFGGTEEAATGGSQIPGDITGDGDVDGEDLFRLADLFGTPGCGGCPEDLDGDGDVTVSDLVILAESLGENGM
jgi:hypothetical protein